MAVISVTEIDEQAEGEWDQMWRRRYKRTYRVECSDRHDSEYTIRTALDGSGNPLIPRIGYAFRAVRGGAVTDAGSFVEGHSYRRVRAGTNPEGSTWEVDVRYGPFDANQFPSDPTQWAPKVTIGGTRVEKVVVVDQAGNPIQNSAGEDFDNPTTIDDSRLTVTVERNERVSAFDLTSLSNYNDTLNDGVWNGFPTRSVKLGIISASGPFYDSNNQVWYYAVTYPFEVSRTYWQRKPLDEGYTYYVGTTRKRVLDLNGHDDPKPVRLDGSGHQVASGGTPVFLAFDVYPAVDWSPLNVDLSTRLGA